MMVVQNPWMPVFTLDANELYGSSTGIIMMEGPADNDWFYDGSAPMRLIKCFISMGLLGSEQALIDRTTMWIDGWYTPSFHT